MAFFDNFLFTTAIPSPYQGIISIGFSLIISSIGMLLSRNFLKKLLNKLEARKKHWDLAFVKALFKPLSTLIFFLGLIISSLLFAHHTGHDQWLDFINGVRKAGLVGFVLWFLIGFIREGEKAFVSATSKRRKDETTVKAVSQVLKIFVLGASALIILQTLGVPLSGVLAFGGVGGIAVGFAAKDLLANFFGGLMIFLDRPFAIGDWIRSPDKQVEGIVEDIGWRLTRLRTLDRRPLYVPNSYFSSIAIENATRMTHRRIKTTVGVRYQDAKKIPAIIKSLEELLQHHPDIDDTRPCVVNLTQFGPSSLDLLIYAFVKKTKFLEFAKVQGKLFLEILEVIEEQGAEVAFPTTTVHVAEEQKKESKMSLADAFGPE